MSKYIPLEKPGTVILEEFFEPYGLSVDGVAAATSVHSWDLSAILYGDRQISAEVDLLLTRYFGLSQGYFLRMRDAYSMRKALQKLRKRIKNVIPIFDPVEKVTVSTAFGGR